MIPLFGESWSIKATPEFRRVRDLPRRVWTEAEGVAAAAELTKSLRAEGGTMNLHPTQAIALIELVKTDGLFGALRVGGGKTLLSLLAPVVLGSKRSVLILPASLIPKTEIERKAYLKHFKVSTSIRPISYQMLGTVKGAEMLEYWKPDTIVCDECHFLKSKKAGVTKRVARYFANHPNVRCVAMSGTVMKNSIKDFAHILEWTHGKDKMPVPNRDDLDNWAAALDEGPKMGQRVGVGVLVDLSPNVEGETKLERGRRAFQKRLSETEGVVVSDAKDGCGASLYISALEYNVNETTEENFQLLREKWQLSTGIELMEAMEVWRHARELALGVHYEWTKRPEDAWLQARKAWSKFVRDILRESKTLDTPLQVANAVDDGTLQDEGVLSRWRAIKDTFEPVTHPIWHDDTALNVCVDWAKQRIAKKENGIIWVEHTFFGHELSKRLGVGYYGAHGLATQESPQPGQSIEAAIVTMGNSGGVVVASVAANSTGRNLQDAAHNLITSPMTGSDGWEQLLGRTHRTGQKADTVFVEFLFGCLEHFDAIERAQARATMALDTIGDRPKLLSADLIYPRDANNREGWRWQKESNTV